MHWTRPSLVMSTNEERRAGSPRAAFDFEIGDGGDQPVEQIVALPRQVQPQEPPCLQL